MINFNENNETLERLTANAILVGASTGGDISYSMKELRGLAEAAGAEVLGEMVQNIEKVNAATYIGSGKIVELGEMAENMGADLIIFNDELTGMQLRNIEDACHVKVIDRTILILDIFADRATSREGKLQVELAQLQYRMPRLLGFGKSLSRLGGGIGTRGPGEKKLETDRRHIQRRMDEIRHEMEEVKQDRSVQRSRREKSDIPIVALVGYTNAGKSSIMNRFMDIEAREDKKVFEKDMLFATLDTSQRLVTLDERTSFILIDTVGFVSKLPHTLVNAFKATLEEIRYADLLLHVVDSSFDNHDFQIEVTNSVIEEVMRPRKGEEIEMPPQIMVYNKIDLAPEFSPLGQNALAISAKTGEGWDNLIATMKSALFSDYETVELLVPYTRGDIVSYVNQKSKPLEVKYEENGTYIKVELSGADAAKLKEFAL